MTAVEAFASRCRFGSRITLGLSSTVSPPQPAIAPRHSARPPKKPVSSLLARFESMNNAPPQSSSAIPRSPAPKPDRLRSFKTTAETAVPPSLSTQKFLPPPTRNRSKTLESKNSDKGDHSTSSSPEPKGPAEESSLPNIASINRRAPYVKKGCCDIQTRYEPKRFDVCGDVVCTSGSFTRGWNTMDGEQFMSLAHTEGVRATAIIFKPGADPDTEGTRIWIGMNSGDMMEVDIASSRIVCNKPGAHGRYEIIAAYRYLNEIWTLDESGCLHIWGPDEDGIPNLNKSPTQSYKVPKGHTFSLVADSQLWFATSKVIRVFEPSLDGSTTFQVLTKPLVTEGTADITSGTTMEAHPGKVFFGHVDGKVSIYSTSDYSCQKVLHISGWKINTMAAVGADLWVGYSTGKVSIYDTKKQPWVTKKEWQAHDSGIYQLKADVTAPYRIERAQVVSIGHDGMVKFWDALLQDDQLEESLKSNEIKYCQFNDLSLLVMSWNAGASTPHNLRYSDGDSSFFQEFVQTSGSPDILVFGFQELVDLEDKTATAKRFLKSKKKDSSDSENMSHRYRDWRDFLLRTLDECAPQGHLYQLLYNAPLVGLFTCIFVKSSLQGRIRNLQGAEVKRGMGGLHGNKGAIAVRFQVDDSSLCFVNCHLAAGQTQTSSRHNDIAAILDAPLFSTERDASARQDYYRGGGDGTLIVDHEICVINGDLNYRIDTMSRDTVVKAVQQNNLGKLRDRDQLLVSRRKNPAFRLRAFEELPLDFAPTYKYDVGTDRYDTSEKRRSPAWCDRLLYRANGKIEQLDYGRHEIKLSDHRPVSGSFRLHVKNVDERKRAQVVMEAYNSFEDVRQKHLEDAKIHYLVVTCGFDEPTKKEAHG
ncbi:inositol polyphosphate phosphatase [Cordyceps militaris CM01]|uniref:Inositol polyphosphate phosphatase n=1 Tax=Cordyceps militaris (strain CM01) TaxID=983644 RepID=G3JP28_CORMM|nr:inositol polyphosphate phosphatase [Cordyceps militaris CM01]EGX89638.1 inositol polyphosphate phosphatase [Cordyceps militaris CM01]